ncbi:hypothetical protein [Rhizobium ruizarguesonis]|uniref:hypothetical protein n=1 Tax=Rhizobium ruizarguesonis TaxID=2081791 RepID=UPI0010302E54|nr:hypothetical protein [Rhizobium ruizarguesonis]TBC98972.1 hypothetical protein ELH25_09940 [Rhizobium ruizarguesonis]TBD15822.1 hypothetical protein ELH24_09985 [Rhizobium ruizarguesonis]TBD27738.1 hypothetical protein ELH20_09270 [Rhizobium ruizarguesonis]TBD71633.1 hypothetical protein ELH11_38425 [Rhizobium ruizarguesonis]TBD94864.1 hypothetical protein ELH09_38145 [Rhizobium ruizarguesonis]
MDCRTKFLELLHIELIPQYCDHPSRGWGRAGFIDNSALVSEADACDFLRAIEGGLIQHVGRGLYSAPRSSAKEQLFWEFNRSAIPRTFAIWLEPVITFAALARLHFEYGWPAELIGTQSKKWEFDLVAYPTQDAENEFIAAEVKKSTNEVEKLAEHLTSLSGQGIVNVTGSHVMRNSIKKYNGLVERGANVFWIVGPAKLSYIFKVEQLGDKRIALKPSDEVSLRHSKSV